MKNVLAIYGAGGLGREIMTIVNSSAKLLNVKQGSIKITESFFVETEPVALSINGIRIFSEDSLGSIENKKIFFALAIADSRAREEISKRMIEKGHEPCSILDSSSIFHSSSAIGYGAILSHLAIVTANSTIGNFFQGNYGSYVAHDCLIGDYVTFAPGASCNGNVRIDDHAYIGANATIIQGTSQKPLHIGKNAFVGMGAVVIRDVPENAVVVGNPARVIKMRSQ
jgi:sugar O-acyltransferase (sialic acid O-acetyltransferase NeuD family)